MSDWAPLLLENQPKLSLSSTSRKTHPRQQKADLQSSHDRTQEASSTLEKMSRLNNSKTKRERKKHETAITEGIAPLDKVMKKGDRQWSGRKGEGRAGVYVSLLRECSLCYDPPLPLLDLSLLCTQQSKSVSRTITERQASGRTHSRKKTDWEQNNWSKNRVTFHKNTQGI